MRGYQWPEHLIIRDEINDFSDLQRLINERIWWMYYVEQLLGDVRDRRMEWSQARGGSDHRSLALSGPVHSGCRGLELHHYGYDSLLQPDVFVQDLASGVWSHRSAQHPVQ